MAQSFFEKKMAKKKMEDHNARIRNVKASVDCKAPVRAEINRAKKEMQEKGTRLPLPVCFSCNIGARVSISNMWPSRGPC